MVWGEGGESVHRGRGGAYPGWTARWARARHHPSNEAHPPPHPSVPGVPHRRGAGEWPGDCASGHLPEAQRPEALGSHPLPTAQWPEALRWHHLPTAQWPEALRWHHLPTAQWPEALGSRHLPAAQRPEAPGSRHLPAAQWPREVFDPHWRVFVEEPTGPLGWWAGWGTS
ncbi:Hypothetical protein CAP_5422 [Chondromyces apiculatus DSM 436]|uniref:Uncharacterized protein n=1 Tax=Chondromyces apiculatus DSM 436 TaxID=1192034 RepID=A0A017T504_9BACT|nr:Hypothetical protein CAP_5422 [Chondromyces apiculatus DSM 436]